MRHVLVQPITVEQKEDVFNANTSFTGDNLHVDSSPRHRRIAASSLEERQRQLLCTAKTGTN
jgi:hypothetical protein